MDTINSMIAQLVQQNKINQSFGEVTISMISHFVASGDYEQFNKVLYIISC